MTFIKPLDNKEKTLKCPRCGAPLEYKSHYICKYCFRFIDGERKNDVKSEVTNISYEVQKVELEKNFA